MTRLIDMLGLDGFCDGFCLPNFLTFYAGYGFFIIISSFLFSRLLPNSALGATADVFCIGGLVIFFIYAKWKAYLHPALIFRYACDMVFLLGAWLFIGTYIIIFLQHQFGDLVPLADISFECNINPGKVELMLFMAYVMAATAEETIKYILARNAFLTAREYMVHPLSLPLYAIIFCMVFTIIENAEYVLKFAATGVAAYNGPYVVAVMRAFIPMHPFWGSMTASYMVQKGEPGWFQCTWRSILLHGTYDFCAFFGTYAKNRSCDTLSSLSFSVIFAIIIFSFGATWQAMQPLAYFGMNAQMVNRNVHYLIEQRELKYPRFFKCIFCFPSRSRMEDVESIEMNESTPLLNDDDDNVAA